MSNLLKPLGAGKKGKRKALNGEAKIWELSVLKNAFCFQASGAEPLFVEFEELTAEGVAYKEAGVLTAYDMILALERRVPDFVGITISESLTLVRERWSECNGLSLEREEEKILFFKDKSLKTVNFMDFHETCLGEENGNISET